LARIALGARVSSNVAVEAEACADNIGDSIKAATREGGY
jgi:hypothetical protein